MKKTVERRGAISGRAIRPKASPVIAIRVPAPLHEEITKAAKAAGKTISDYMAEIVAAGQKWQGFINEARKVLQQANVEAKRITDGALLAQLRRYNWKHNEKGWWAPPEVHGLPASGFIEGEPGELVAQLDPRIAAGIASAVRSALKEKRRA